MQICGACFTNRCINLLVFLCSFVNNWCTSRYLELFTCCVSVLPLTFSVHWLRFLERNDTSVFEVLNFIPPLSQAAHVRGLRCGMVLTLNRCLVFHVGSSQRTFRYTETVAPLVQQLFQKQEAPREGAAARAFEEKRLCTVSPAWTVMQQSLHLKNRGCDQGRGWQRGQLPRALLSKGAPCDDKDLF